MFFGDMYQLIDNHYTVLFDMIGLEVIEKLQQLIMSQFL